MVMKVVAFNGSARKKGNTEILLNTVLDELGKEGLETELVHLSRGVPSGLHRLLQVLRKQGSALCGR